VVLAPALLYWQPFLQPGATSMPPFYAIVITFALVPVAIGLAALYYVYYWGVKGATPAKHLLGLAVEGLEGERPVGVARAGIRFLGFLLSGGLFGIGFLMILFLGGAYYAWFWGVKGATPGKKMIGLAVAAEDGTVPIGLSRATLRVLGYAASFLLLGIGFLMIAFGGTALHDRMAGTRVVARGK
jgi:uncharacterized RDD family membrane protein YckC